MTTSYTSSKYPHIVFSFEESDREEILKDLAGMMKADGTQMDFNDVVNYELRNLESIENFARDIFYRWNGVEYDDNDPATNFTVSSIGNVPWFKITIEDCRGFANSIFTSSNILDNATVIALRYASVPTNPAT